jgi:hypothetical protein
MELAAEGDQECHRGQHNFACKDVAEQTKPKGDDTGNLRISSRMPTKPLIPFIKPLGPLKLKNLLK